MTAAPHGPAVAGPVHRAPRPVRPPVRARPGWVLAAVYGGGVTLPALWWADTPSVVGVGGWLTGAGRITGLLAGYACAVLLALMARVRAGAVLPLALPCARLVVVGESVLAVGPGGAGFPADHGEGGGRAQRGPRRTAARQVDAVPGATYTSEGYLSSLQSALDNSGA
jgi:hypothetical protein